MVVSSVDLARYFPWLIGIRYIGFSNLKTFLVMSTTEHVLLPTSESKSSFLNQIPPVPVYRGITGLDDDCSSMMLDQQKDFCQTSRFYLCFLSKYFHFVALLLYSQM